MAQYKTSKSYYPTAGYNGSLGKQRQINKDQAKIPVKEQLKPQDPMDKYGPKYDGVISKSWLRNGDGTTKPGFDGSRKRSK
jgi:hypothetical protein